jgi:hypothetical protein|tara:strand:+ start:385 stop:579 length:195 start_codon:yes stop_codon:yes gene_type:complete
MDNYVENLKKIKELADGVKVLDLLDPSSHTVSIVTEIIERCKHIPALEMIDNNFINMDNFEAEA